MNRIINPNSFSDFAKLLTKVEVSSQGVENMVPKAFSLPIRLTGVELGAANIIKQEMLTVGGDAALARGIVEGVRKETDIILLGTVDKIRKLLRKLSHYTTFGIPGIREDIAKLLSIYTSGFSYNLNCRGKIIALERPKLMGILNVTPDSFSDGGDYSKTEDAVKAALKMTEQGAEIIDIGGESSRPSANPVDAETELRRVIPVIEKLKESHPRIIVSVDTCKAKVAERALEAGADLINDISALRFDPEMAEVLGRYPEVPVVLMHIQGTPENMQLNPVYDDVVDEILEFLHERILFCNRAGIGKERIIVDPGIGFGKNFEHNSEIFQRLIEFHALGVPVMIGASRKSFISKIYRSEPKQRLSGSLAATALAFYSKVNVIRVHDVEEHYEFLQTLSTLIP